MSEFDHRRAPGRAGAAANVATPTPGKRTLVQTQPAPRAPSADAAPKRAVEQVIYQIELYLIQKDFAKVDIGDPALESIAASARRVASLLGHQNTDAIREWETLKPRLQSLVGHAKKLHLAHAWVQSVEGAIDTTQERVGELIAKQAEEAVDARTSRTADLDGGSGLDGEAALAELRQAMSAARKAYERAKFVVKNGSKGVGPMRNKAAQIRNRQALEVNVDHSLQLRKDAETVAFPKHDIDPGVKALHGTPGEVASPGLSPNPASARGLDAASNVLDGIGKVLDIFEIIEAPGKIEKKLEDFQEKGVLGQFGTVLDVISVGNKAVTSSIIIVLEAVQPFVSAAVATQIAEHLKFLKGAGVVFSAVQIAAGVMNMIDALNRGDDRAAVDAFGEAGTGAVSLMTVGVTGATVGITAAVGGIALGTVLMWKEGLKAFGEMGATLRTMKDRAAKTAVVEFIAAAHEVGDAGAALAAAEDELHMQTANPAHADYRLQQKYEAVLQQMVEERRAVFEQRYMYLMEKHIGYHDHDRLGGYPDLVKELGTIPPDAEAMVARWAQFAQGAKRMARYAVAYYGGDANDERAYLLTAGGIADKDNPFLKQ